MTEAERRAALEQIGAEVRACTRCRLHEGRTAAVPGEGHPSTEVLLVGEAPGLNEDRQGRPFVGAAGGFLTELLGTVGWSREEVFITNIVKCRPPQNRDPEPDEIAACAPFLRRQVEALDPALVITLGRHSMGRFMPGARIGQVHGTTAAPPPDTGAAAALVFAMYHPAAALHQGSLRQTLLDDMTGAPGALLEARRRRDEARAEAANDGVGSSAAVEPPAAEAGEVEPGPVEAVATGPGAAERPESMAIAPELAVAPEPVTATTKLVAVAADPEPEPPQAGPTLGPAASQPRPSPEDRPGPVERSPVEAGPTAPPSVLVPALDAPPSDQMTLF